MFTGFSSSLVWVSVCVLSCTFAKAQERRTRRGLSLGQNRSSPLRRLRGHGSSRAFVAVTTPGTAIRRSLLLRLLLWQEHLFKLLLLLQLLVVVKISSRWNVGLLLLLMLQLLYRLSWKRELEENLFLSHAIKLLSVIVQFFGWKN